VRRTLDGTLVCVHDDDLVGLGAVAGTNFASLSPSQRAEVLTFDAFLDLLDTEDPARASSIHLDLKDEGYELEAIDAVTARGRSLFVTTLIADSVITVREHRPEIDAYLTIGASRAGLDAVRGAQQRLGELFPFSKVLATRATGVAVHHRLATPWLRNWCAHRGLAVVVWTVDDDADLERWLATPVDVVTTNRPLTALAIRESLP
jgi:glycerophosphoryl diester phosphodiesterase